MDLVSLKIAAAGRALATLEELLPPRTSVERDAAIQRFDYTFEATWKAAQVHLREVEGLETGSPKRVVRESCTVGLLDDGEAARALDMADDRNLTAHTDHEEVAVAIVARLEGHARLLRGWLEARNAGRSPGSTRR